MKKFIALLAVITLTFIGFSNESKAAENENLTPDQVQEVNEKMEEMRIELNQQLENGTTNSEVSRTLSFSDEPLIMGITNSDSTTNNDIVTTVATGKQNYSAYVRNTTGFNFGHTVSGTFTYQTGQSVNQVTNVTHSVTLNGAMYGKNHNTNIQNENPDGTMKRLNSNGTFTALKYTPFTYETNIVITFQPGSYRILQASIS